jgi:hypothetical protein
LSKDSDQIGKKIISVDKIPRENHTEINATFDDGDKAQYIESRYSKAASRAPRWVDYALSNTLNTTIQNDDEKEQ